MPKKSKAATPTKPLDRGNHISEWLGHRIYPAVKLHIDSFIADRYGTCPFLSEALREMTRCIKNENSFGVCTVSSPSNGTQQDWLVCPYRVISSNIVSEACKRIFDLDQSTLPIPAPLLQNPEEVQNFKRYVRKNQRGFVFFQDKLGGEISVLATGQSPELSFDVTLVEVIEDSRRFKVARYGILEIQTMDFHGSYKHAVQNLTDALRLHKKKFPSALEENLQWASEKIEGPNIANVFKRTFYQALLKFQLSGKGAAAGTVLAIPEAVWDSWQPFLGAPKFSAAADGVYELAGDRDSTKQAPAANALICIFDLAASSKQSISPVQIKKFIRVSAEQLSHHAFAVVPAGMLKSISETDSILTRIRARLSAYWSEVS